MLVTGTTFRWVSVVATGHIGAHFKLAVTVRCEAGSLPDATLPPAGSAGISVAWPRWSEPRQRAKTSKACPADAIGSVPHGAVAALSRFDSHRPSLSGIVFPGGASDSRRVSIHGVKRQEIIGIGTKGMFGAPCWLGCSRVGWRSTRSQQVKLSLMTREWTRRRTSRVRVRD